MLYNCHTHSENSHDSDVPVLRMCGAAADAGLAGLAVTDHCDCEYAARDHAAERIRRSCADAEDAARRFGPRLKVLRGIELGDPLYNPLFAEQITAGNPYDVVLLSVHAVRHPLNDAPFSGIDFSGWTDAQIDSYLLRYFEDVLESIRRFDFDVLSHLTVPIRYIRYRYDKNPDLSPCYPLIGKILDALISADKTLELNTQGAEEPIPFFLPDREILSLYLRAGGTKISLGSDAHRPEQIAVGLEKGIKLLASLQVSCAVYYENRRAIFYPVE